MVDFQQLCQRLPGRVPVDLLDPNACDVELDAAVLRLDLLKVRLENHGKPGKSAPIP